jgi:hypothetical protein
LYYNGDGFSFIRTTHLFSVGKLTVDAYQSTYFSGGKMKSIFGAQVLLVICLLCTAALGQITISNGNTVSENFDTLGTVNTSLTDNTAPTYLGFYTLRSAANVSPKPLIAGTGTSNTSQFYNFGQAANSNRAVGWVNANGVTSSLGLRLQNNGTTPITSLQIQFAGEQWRDGNASAETMTFDYQIGATVTSLSAGTYTNVPALTFTSPNSPGGSGSWNGDLAANRAAFNQTISVNIPAGQEIMLRWSSTGNSGQGDGIGVDDISISAVGPTAGDATISGRVTDRYGRAISSAAISVQDLVGNRKVVYTNTFGYYSVAGLEVGQAYVLSVSARRYTFANPSVVIDLSDNFSGANFVASR